MSRLNLSARILVSLLLLTAAISYKLSTLTDYSTKPLKLPATASTHAANIQPDLTVYFTAPEHHTISDENSNGIVTNGEISGGEKLETVLIAAIHSARLSIDLAIYDLSLPKIKQALLDAYQRGITVRVVTESDNASHVDIQALQTAGIPVRGDNAAGLMHNKYIIIDQLEVWTGSTNLTYPGVYQENNNLLRLRSAEMAQAFQSDFDALFVKGCFGSGSVQNIACLRHHHPPLQLGTTKLETYFSPGGGTDARLVALINSAKESIYFLAFSFTADDIAKAIIARAMDGIPVSGVFEDSQVSSAVGVDSIYGLMRTAGLDVHLDGNPANMHHKVIILDRTIVITGSFNFSRSAEARNEENLLVIHDPDLAAQYLAEFQHVYQEAKP